MVIMEELLNQYQKRGVLISLQYFEKALHEAERWLRGDVNDGVLIHRELRLAPEKRVKVEEKIDEAYREIAFLVEKFGFEGNHENMAAAMRAEFYSCWESMCERESKSLKGYGAVDPRLESELDPTIQRLASLAMQIAMIFQSGESWKG